MNTKIYKLIKENLHKAFNLPKYEKIRTGITANTQVDELPWTPVRYKKFKDYVEAELALEDCSFNGALRDIVNILSERYIKRFFGEIWRPRTDDYDYTGRQLAEDIAKQNPKNVLDVGCGYHPFKGKIPNLVGIDPYNHAADYEVDILDYRVKPESHDHIIALGSINFNSKEDIEARFSHCVNLLEKGGKFYLRANPGLQHVTGPYVDVFEWTFEVVKQLEVAHGLHLDTFKQDNNGRLYFVYSRPQ